MDLLGIADSPSITRQLNSGRTTALWDSAPVSTFPIAQLGFGIQLSKIEVVFFAGTLPKTQRESYVHKTTLHLLFISPGKYKNSPPCPSHLLTDKVDQRKSNSFGKHGLRRAHDQPYKAHEVIRKRSNQTIGRNPSLTSYSASHGRLLSAPLDSYYRRIILQLNPQVTDNTELSTHPAYRGGFCFDISIAIKSPDFMNLLATPIMSIVPHGSKPEDEIGAGPYYVARATNSKGILC